MKIRYYIDPETEQPHIYNHGVNEYEVEDVLRKPGEDRPGREGSRVSIGRTKNGRYLRVIYVPDKEKIKMTRQSKFPTGWDEKRVKRVLEHYETQSEDEAVAEDEAAYEDTNQTFMEIPNELIPVVRELIAKKTELTPNV